MDRQKDRNRWIDRMSDRDKWRIREIKRDYEIDLFMDR